MSTEFALEVQYIQVSKLYIGHFTHAKINNGLEFILLLCKI